MEHYDFRPISSENLADLVFLVNKIAGTHHTVSYYHKKYHTPDSNGLSNGWLAFEKKSGRAVAVGACLPQKAVLPDGSIVRISQMIETFTLPEHRGKGLMTRLLRLTLDDQINTGVRLFFTLPNQNNQHGLIHKLGFQQVAQMFWFEIPVRTIPFEALCRRAGIPGLFRGWAGWQLRGYLAPEGFVLSNSVLAEGYAGLLHDQNFFAYKTFSYNKICRFSGIDSWLRFQNGLLVGDVAMLEGCTQEAFDAWLFRLKKLASFLGLRRVVFQAFPGSRLYNYLIKNLTPNPSWAICCRTEDEALVPFLSALRFGFGDFETF